MSTARATRHALYRFYDGAGRLLYVGITLDPGSRWNTHRKDKPWWHDVAKVTVEIHPTREAVLEAERAAIVGEKPVHNVVHNRGPVASSPTAGAHVSASELVFRANVITDAKALRAATGLGLAGVWGHIHRGEYQQARRRIDDLRTEHATRWGARAQDMPDDCHDICVKQDRLAIYFPYRWREGRAHYVCERGHHWTCGWGHNLSGDDPSVRGVDQMAVAR